MKKFLIFGLPGAGKTTLAEKLQKKLNAEWLNADKVRSQFNDWDFSEEGRLRQAQRMSDLCSEDKLYIVDFVAPTEELRKTFNPDFTIWMNTIEEGRFEDTNKLFQKPNSVDIEITDFNYDMHDIILNIIYNLKF